MEESNITFLSKLLRHEELLTTDQNNLKVATYLTLLSLNNHNYQEKNYLEEQNKIDDYLRKINNLKVKIQLKRKDEEITNLLNEIKALTTSNEQLINQYNKDKTSIIDTLETRDPKEITNLIDKLTKYKINKYEKKEEYNNLRNYIINNKCQYYIDNNNIYINTDIVISLDDFYKMFDYLLNKANYHQAFQDDSINIQHDIIIDNLIKSIDNEISLDKEIIPIILTNIINYEIPNYNEIDTSKFSIDNIKISDLYSLAKYKGITNEHTPKWQKILIPNEFLYQKISEIINNGTYYFKDDKFILEHLDNGINDFKTSINIADMYKFLSDNINNIIETQELKRHI